MTLHLSQTWTLITSLCVVGYSIPDYAYLWLDPSENKIFTSRHVIFVENNFPFHNTASHNESSTNFSSLETWFHKSIPESFHFPSSMSSPNFNSSPSTLISTRPNIPDLLVQSNIQPKNMSSSTNIHPSNSYGESSSRRSESLNQDTSSSVSSFAP